MFNLTTNEKTEKANSPIIFNRSRRFVRAFYRRGRDVNFTNFYPFVKGIKNVFRNYVTNLTRRESCQTVLSPKKQHRRRVS